MIRLRPQYWLLALLLALAAHLAAFLITISVPSSESAMRGGGLNGNGDARFGSGNGVVVNLGPAQQAPAPPLQPPPAKQQPAAKPEAKAAPKPDTKPEPDTKSEPAAKAEPKAETKPAPTPAPPPDTAAKPQAPAAAIPTPKPASPTPPPAPKQTTESARATPPAPAAREQKPERPEPAKEQEKAAEQRRQAATKVNRPVSFGSPAGRRGNASGNAEGADRELTYGDRVMLWLQAHGQYPLQAARYGIEGTVVVEFAIDRRGRILYYKLVKDSKWYLLNTAVRQMMDRSSPVPPFPPDITDKELTFTVPVHFSPP